MNLPARNTLVQHLGLYPTPTLRATMHSVTDRQTDDNDIMISGGSSPPKLGVQTAMLQSPCGLRLSIPIIRSPHQLMKLLNVKISSRTSYSGSKFLVLD